MDPEPQSSGWWTLNLKLPATGTGNPLVPPLFSGGACFIPRFSVPTEALHSIAFKTSSSHQSLNRVGFEIPYGGREESRGMVLRQMPLCVCVCVCTFVCVVEGSSACLLSLLPWVPWRWQGRGRGGSWELCHPGGQCAPRLHGDVPPSACPVPASTNSTITWRRAERGRVIQDAGRRSDTDRKSVV